MKTSLNHHLQRYKRKYYFDKILKGSLLSISLLLAAYTTVVLLEYFNQFSSGLRTGIFWGYLALTAYVLGRWVVIPVSKLLNIGGQLSDEEAARQIGEFFPEVRDRLLNTLQLNNLSSQDDSLIRASIEQRTQQLSVVRFTDAIQLRKNQRYLRFLVPILLGLGLLMLFMPKSLTESTARILNYSQEYVPEAPFSFVLDNEDLVAYNNEDFEVKMHFEGSARPEQAYLLINGRRHKMHTEDGEQYSYTIPNITQNTDFQVFAAGFNSQEYEIKLRNRPNLTGFDVHLNYPQYLGQQDEDLKNTGNFTIPEGTQVTWDFASFSTDSLFLRFERDTAPKLAEQDGKQFVFKRQMMQSNSYQVKLKNQHSTNKEAIRYRVKVVPDEYPEVSLEPYEDSTLRKYLLVGGSVSDDHGISQLKLFYQLTRPETGQEGEEQAVNLRVGKNTLSQNYYQELSLDSLRLQPGDQLEYYVRVWDNDGVNGPKSSRTRIHTYRMPTQRELMEEMSQSASQTQNQIEETHQKAQQLRDEMEKLQEQLRGKRKLSWQEKKNIEELIKKKKKLEKDIQQMQRKNRKNQKMQERFGSKDEEIRRKSKELQKLMDEIMDEETKKLYEELQKLMDEKNQDIDKVNKKLNEIDKKEFNVEKELDRTMEMFKQLKYEQKHKQVTDQLKKLAEKQDKLAEKTKEAKSKAENDSLQKEQEELEKEFENLKEKRKELEKMNKELAQKKQEADTKKEEQKAKESMKKSKQKLSKNRNKKAAEQQQNAADQMKKMAEKMQQAMESGQQKALRENMDDLRDILENLVTLSFEQEEVMKNFKGVNQSDPRFVSLGQRQLKLRDDAKVIEDSLMALAKRVFQIKSFVTREVSEMKNNMEGATKGIRQRHIGKASYKQQLAMTSMNNLALMLDDVLKNMQRQMANSMAQSQGSKSCNKPNAAGKPKNGMPKNLSELQKSLNKSIQQLKKSGKSGKELSEELSRLSAKQEAIRQALKELEKKSKGQKPGQKGEGGQKPGGDKAKKIREEMEKTEEDLVNKNISEETIKRQKDIMTRLLEAEKALRERKLDKEREAKTAEQDYDHVPPSYKKYLKEKEQQVELLKTLSPSLTPFYKEEANKYFNTLNKQ